MIPVTYPSTHNISILLIISFYTCINIGQSIGDTAARLPYKKIKEYGISMDGLPQNMFLKHPSSYGRLTLKQILSNKDNITVHGT